MYAKRLLMDEEFKFQITASATPGGSISPSGTIDVEPGASQSFNISPSSGYSWTQLNVDGASIVKTSPYTFSNVQANHTIAATFAIDNAQQGVQSISITGTLANSSDASLNYMNFTENERTLKAAVVVKRVSTSILSAIITVKAPDNTATLYTGSISFSGSSLTAAANITLSPFAAGYTVANGTLYASSDIGSLSAQSQQFTYSSNAILINASSGDYTVAAPAGTYRFWLYGAGGNGAAQASQTYNSDSQSNPYIFTRAIAIAAGGSGRKLKGTFTLSLQKNIRMWVTGNESCIRGSASTPTQSLVNGENLWSGHGAAGSAAAATSTGSGGSTYPTHSESASAGAGGTGSTTPSSVSTIGTINYEENINGSAGSGSWTEYKQQRFNTINPAWTTFTAKSFTGGQTGNTGGNAGCTTAGAVSYTGGGSALIKLERIA